MVKVQFHGLYQNFVIYSDYENSWLIYSSIKKSCPLQVTSFYWINSLFTKREPWLIFSPLKILQKLLSGTPSLMTCTRPPICLHLDNRLYMFVMDRLWKEEIQVSTLRNYIKVQYLYDKNRDFSLWILSI